MRNYSIPLSTRTVLEEKLKTTPSPWDRLPLLLELTQEPSSQDHHYGLQRAYEALALARQLKDRFWIARSMRTIASALTLTSRYSEILYYLEESSRILGRLNETFLKAQTDLTIASTYIRMGEIEKAAPLIFFARNVFRSLEEPYWLSRVYHVLGDLHRTISDYANAIRCYRRAISILEHDLTVHGDAPTALGGDYQTLANTYYRIDDIGRAKKHLFRSLAIQRKAKHYPTMAAALGNLATMYLTEGDFSGAERYIRLAGGMYRRINYPDGEAMAWAKLGTVYAHKGEPQKAARCYRKALSVTRNTENLEVKAIVLQKFGGFRLDNGQPRRGRMLLRAALDLYGPKGQAHLTHTLHEDLARAYEAEGNVEEALLHFKEHQRLKEEKINADKYRQAGRAEVEGRIRKLVRELEKENSENDALRKEIEDKEAALLAATLSLIHKEERRDKRNRVIDGPLHETSAPSPDNWEIFARQFHKVHHGFYPALLKRFPDLTLTEAKVCSLIRTGLSSREIAGVLGIAKRTVDNHRMHILRKMNLPPGTSLGAFIAAM